MVSDYYRDKYWNTIWGNRIIHQGLANKFFDCAVNAGIIQATKWVQRALPGLVVDGHMGPKTLVAINQGNPVDVLSNVRMQQAEFYRMLVHRDKSQEVFLRGWLLRANG
jgi:lysozyme family protein